MIITQAFFTAIQLSSLVCAGQNHPVDAVHQFHFVEVDEQTDRDVEQLHVAQELCFVDGENWRMRLIGITYTLHTFSEWNEEFLNV
jgi:hypothetical protein